MNFSLFLSTCRKQYQATSRATLHESCVQAQTTWSPLLLSTQTAWENQCLPRPEQVRTARNRNMCNLLQNNSLITLTLSFSLTPNCPLEPLLGVTTLRLVQAGFFTLALGWDAPADQVQGYRITYGPTGERDAHLQIYYIFQ